MAVDHSLAKTEVYPRFEQGLLEDFDGKSKSSVITTTFSRESEDVGRTILVWDNLH